MTTETDFQALNATMTTALYLTKATDIVTAYVSKNSVPLGDLPALIASTFAAVKGAAEPVAVEPEKPEPIVPIKKTVTLDYIISLEDGKRYKSLKRHLTTRGITPDEYRKKWGLPYDYPMVCEAYSKERSELAKSIGLGNMRGEKHPKSAAYDGPKRPRGRPRKLAIVPAGETETQAA